MVIFFLFGWAPPSFERALAECHVGLAVECWETVSWFLVHGVHTADAFFFLRFLYFSVPRLAYAIDVNLTAKHVCLQAGNGRLVFGLELVFLLSIFSPKISWMRKFSTNWEFWYFVGEVFWFFGFPCVFFS